MVHSNFLQFYRKKSPLTQSDISFLLNIEDDLTLSRIENGHKLPSPEILFGYRYLFNTPSTESFYQIQKDDVLLSLQTKILNYIDILKSKEFDPKDAMKISFLEETLTRLNNEK